MSERGAQPIVAGAGVSFEGVLERLSALGRADGQVELLIPRDSGLLLTASEFRAVKDVADRNRLDLSIRSDDALRKQLADLMGLPCKRVPTEVLAAAMPKPAPPAPTPVSEPAPSAENGPATAPVTGPSGPAAALPGRRFAGASGATGEAGTAATAPAPPAMLAGPQVDDEPAEPTFDQIVDRRHRGGGVPRWLGFAIGALALLALGAVALLLLAPRVTVALTLARQPVAGDLVFDVTASGTPLDGDAAIALAATPVSTEARFEGSVPATGVLLEPDGTATGSVLFANPAAKPVTVPAGTELTTGGGTVFLLDADVAVPGVDPVTGSAGNADGTVTAREPGSGGNAEVGDIGGRLESGVYYSNRLQAASGGTDREIAVVSAEDIAALLAQAEASITGVGASFADLPAGTQLLPGSVVAGDSVNTFSAAEGAPAETLELVSVRPVEGLAWSPDQALLEAGARAPEALAALVPVGHGLDQGTVAFGALQPVIETPQGARFTVPVTAEAVAIFGPREARALAERLAADPESAAQVVAETPGVAAFYVLYLPEWLPARMPRDPDRIEVTVDGRRP